MPPSSASAVFDEPLSAGGIGDVEVAARGANRACTRAPAASSARAVAAPIPLEAPVTIARLPSRAAIRGSHRTPEVNGGLKRIGPADV